MPRPCPVVLRHLFGKYEDQPESEEEKGEQNAREGIVENLDNVELLPKAMNAFLILLLLLLLCWSLHFCSKTPTFL